MKFATFDRIISPEVGARIAGYEGDCLAFTTRDAVRFLQTAADAMFDLRDSLFPEDAAKDEPFPDFVVRPLVDIPKNW